MILFRKQNMKTKYNAHTHLLLQFYYTWLGYITNLLELLYLDEWSDFQKLIINTK